MAPHRAGVGQCPCTLNTLIMLAAGTLPLLSAVAVGVLILTEPQGGENDA